MSGERRDLPDRFGDGTYMSLGPPTLDSVLTWLGVADAEPAARSEAAERYRDQLSEAEVKLLVEAGYLEP